MKTNTQKAKMGGGKAKKQWLDGGTVCGGAEWLREGLSTYLEGQSLRVCVATESKVATKRRTGDWGGGPEKAREESSGGGTVSTSAPAELLRMGALVR